MKKVLKKKLQTNIQNAILLELNKINSSLGEQIRRTIEKSSKEVARKFLKKLKEISPIVEEKKELKAQKPAIVKQTKELRAIKTKVKKAISPKSSKSKVLKKTK